MVQLAQTYIHLRPYKIGRKRLNSLGRRAEKIAVKAALDIYGGGVTVDVRLEEGENVGVCGRCAHGLWHNRGLQGL